MVRMANNTGRDMVESGAWAKVGRKHYRHISGREIKWDCNHWGWELLGEERLRLYTVLWAARHVVEQETREPL